MTFRMVPFLVGFTLSAISCADIPGTAIGREETEVVRFSVPTLDD